MWKAGIEPGALFDKASPSPLLVKFMKEGRIPKGRVLVPGCGRGYDVTLLADIDHFVVGLDIVEEAIEEAKKRLSSLENVATDQLSFECSSFFDLQENQFDFVYDYTFLCALDPSIRQNWALKMCIRSFN
jgi:2-polyprenyl-3-methyl-5-hydroxy-6-metoxy-1,4-benzoquinol methylase